jgi:hypothetical protein
MGREMAEDGPERGSAAVGPFHQHLVQAALYQ